MMGSKIFQCVTRDGELSVALLDTTALVNEAIARHRLSSVAAAALGKTMTAAAYLCSWLKEESSVLHVQLFGNGPGGKISVSGSGALGLSGHVGRPDLVLPPLQDGENIPAFVGQDGFLRVVRMENGLPFDGSCALVKGDVSSDFAAYFKESEQRTVSFALVLRMGQTGTCLFSGGLFVQALPFAGENALSFAEEKVTSLSSRLFELAQEGETALKAHFGAERVFSREICFSCRCSREKAANAVLAMGRKEAFALLKEQGGVCVHCPDCNTDYFFEEQDLVKIFE